MSSTTPSPISSDGREAHDQILPRLLPAAQRPGPPTDPRRAVLAGPISEVSPITTAITPRARRTHVVPAACEACRKRKSKCSAQRPKCLACIQRGTECHYTTASEETHTQALKRKLNELQSKQDASTPFEQLFQVLQTRPEEESLNIYHIIRTGADIGSILRHVRDGDLLMQMLVVPEVFRQYRFPYDPQMPSFLLAASNQYLESVVFDATALGHLGPAEAALQRHLQAVPYLCPYLKPFRAAHVMDERLAQVEVAPWTRVMSHERVLKQLLHDYLLYQHVWTGFFHKDHFLDDMRQGKSRFCSQLLVNAIMACACHISHGLPRRAHFWIPENLGYRFLSESRRLWELESIQYPICITTIQAGLLLNLISNVNGMDKIGNTYLEHTIRMAQAEDLFQPSATIKDQAMRHSRAVTAWSLYSWQSLLSYQFSQEPWLTDSPSFNLPDETRDAEYYGEIRIMYPPASIIHNLSLGQTTTSIIGHSLILNMLSQLLFGRKARQPTVQQIVEFKDRLDQSFHRLPDSLKPLTITYPLHLILHMEYHGIMIRLMQLLGAQRDAMQPHTTLARDALQLMYQSEIRLETLVRLYYLRHSFDDYAPRLMNWLAFLGCLANERLKSRAASGSGSGNATGSASSSDAESNTKGKAAATATSPSSTSGSDPPTMRNLRSTLILCALGLHSQGQSYQLAVPVYRALRDRMVLEDTNLLDTYISARPDEGGEQPLMAHYVQSQWSMPNIALNEDPRSANLQSLMSKYNKTPLGMVKDDEE